MHFLAAGLALFLLGSAIKPPERDDATIVVDRAALLSFIQYRSKAFEAEAAASVLDGMDAARRERLIADYVREEALSREAKTLGLDANDYVIRQRMVQKVEFLAEAAAAPPEPGDAEIAAYFEANADRYRSPPAATLTHVFVSTADKSAQEAEAEALRLLAQLKKSGAGFTDATKYGERFLFHKNYVDRTDDYIRSQLGDAVGDAIFDPAGPLDEWLGPFKSEYGEHLIFVTARTKAELPALADVADLVKADLVEERRQAAIHSAVDQIVARYKIDDRFGDGG